MVTEKFLHKHVTVQSRIFVRLFLTVYVSFIHFWFTLGITNKHGRDYFDNSFYELHSWLTTYFLQGKSLKLKELKSAYEKSENDSLSKKK